MTNILLLTDFSSKSQNSHHYACQLFKGRSCTFYFLSIQKIWEYTMDDFMAAPGGDSIDEALLGDDRSQLNEQVKVFSDLYQGDNFVFKVLVDYDDFVHSVNQAVEKFKIDLVVIGTDGKTGLIEAIFSSHTLNLVRRVNCPLLIVPKNYTFQIPKHVRYLLDYDDFFETCGKEPLVGIVTHHNSKIEVLRLTFGKDFDYSTNEKEQQEIQKLFPNQTIKYQTFIDSDPSTVLLQSLLIEPAQLEVLSAKTQTFLDRIFSKSHLSKIVNTATIPLLILRDCE